MALTPEFVVLGLVRKAKLLRLQLAEQVPLLHPQGHQPPLVKRHLMTSDTRIGWSAISPHFHSGTIWREDGGLSGVSGLGWQLAWIGGTDDGSLTHFLALYGFLF